MLPGVFLQKIATRLNELKAHLQFIRNFRSLKKSEKIDSIFESFQSVVYVKRGLANYLLHICQ